MRRIRCGFEHCGIRFGRGYYDGPWWELNFLFFWIVWNWEGLPQLFQDRKKADS